MELKSTKKYQKVLKSTITYKKYRKVKTNQNAPESPESTKEYPKSTKKYQKGIEILAFKKFF